MKLIGLLIVILTILVGLKKTKISYNQQPELYSYNSIEVLTWLGSDDSNSQYYGGLLNVASNYDDKNNTNLIYTIPEFCSGIFLLLAAI